jgi:hypothetical protein
MTRTEEIVGTCKVIITPLAWSKWGKEGKPSSNILSSAWRQKKKSNELSQIKLAQSAPLLCWMTENSAALFPLRRIKLDMRYLAEASFY